MTNWKSWTGVLLLALAASQAVAQEQLQSQEFLDSEFGYRFLYPADWKLERLPEGKENRALRVRLGGPDGSSFVVIVENTGEPLSKLEFQAKPKPEAKIDAMMRRTLDRTYRAISKNLGALDMKVGEKRNLTGDDAVKFYLTTLHRMKAGSPVVVAGTHAYPFGKDYSINFIMTAFHHGNTAQSRILTLVFNSFSLLEPTAPRAP